MNTESENVKHKALTEDIIGAFYAVYNKLGYGFLEKVYENAMIIELASRDIPVVQQAPLRVLYDGKVIGEYFADLLVDGKVIVEIKAARNLALENGAQLLNYLKATEMEVGLLLNFGPEPKVKRKVFDKFGKNKLCLSV
jgi:GxxExxY protein